MTLRQAVETALRQNPDIILARLDEEHARHAVRVAHDPFTPRVAVGSGLAYSNGFPMSIEGSAPSVVQARASEFIFNRQQSLQVAQAKEEARGAAIATAGKRDEVAYRVTSLFLDAERAARMGELARKDADSQAKVLTAVQAQVREGRALPLAEKTAAYHLAYAQQAAENLAGDQAAAETSLAVALGFTAEDRVRPVEEERPAPALPASEAEALEAALENNYAEFFSKFQRNNGEVGVSFQLPVLAGTGVSAQVAESETDAAHLRVEMANARNRIATDLQQSWRDVHRAEGAANLARLDLDLAREQLSVDLAQMAEGRLTLREVEEARVAEDQKWIAFYDAEYALEKARWNVLRLTGGLVSSIQTLP